VKIEGLTTTADFARFGSLDMTFHPAKTRLLPAPEADHATLVATMPGGFPKETVGAFGTKRGPSFEGLASAARAEFVEGVYVSRGAEVRLGASDFHRDHQQGLVVLRPPAPFAGSATFRRRPDGGSSWVGSLRAPILGAGLLALTGGRFRARLLDAVPSDE
jgi:hypothetical protein